jgi:hypothetical protein
MTLPQAARAAVTAYEGRRAEVAELDRALQRANGAISLVKEQAAAGNPEAIASDLRGLNAVKVRHTPVVAALCDAYLAETHNKLVTEIERDATQAALDHHRAAVFPGYQTAVNLLPAAVQRRVPTRQRHLHEHPGRAGLQLQRGHQ